MSRAAPILLIVLAFAARPDDAPAGPTKEQAIQHLRAYFAALDARDFDKAATYLAMPPKTTPEELTRMMNRQIEQREITREGLEVFIPRAAWGKLADVQPDKAEAWAKKFDVPLDQCWGLIFEKAQAAFVFDGKGLKIIRCNDIGKLKK
jgi:hypothetical protein